MKFYSDKDFESFDGYSIDGITKSSDYDYWGKRSRKNSVGEKPPVRMSEAKEEDILSATRNRIIAVAAAVVVIVSGFTGGLIKDLSHDLADRKDIYNYLSQYYDIYYENRHPISASYNYWLDNKKMGQEVAKSDDPQLALYAVYDKSAYERISNVSEVFDVAMEYAKSNDIEGITDAFNDSSSFSEYVKSLGCVDKNGEPDFEAYSDSMNKIVLAKSMLEDATKDATFSKEDGINKGGK